MARGEAMRRARKNANMSMPKLAKRAGISAETLYQLETKDDSRDGRIGTLILLADVLGVGLDEYIGRTVPNRKE